MAEPHQEWARSIFAGDRRAIARAISAVESGDMAGHDLLKLLFRRAGRAYVIGITGSPGAGKSTLVERLAGAYRGLGKKVGILAVDPSSPFSGGAILGDRIRMQRLSGDEGVYIRSMATRGEMGGLAPATYDAVTVLDAAGCEVVLVETVGVGQDEVEVARLADVTVLLLVPGMGDDVQIFKAGVMEIADIFVINKSDRPGAEGVEHDITNMLSIAPRRSWQPPILNTVATTGEGVDALRMKLEEFRGLGAQKDLRQERLRARWRARLMALLRRQLLEDVLRNHLKNGALDALVEDLVAHRLDPYSAVEGIIQECGLVKEPSSGSAS